MFSHSLQRTGELLLAQVGAAAQKGQVQVKVCASSDTLVALANISIVCLPCWRVRRVTIYADGTTEASDRPWCPNYQTTPRVRTSSVINGHG
jgi:hypothetical protein